MTNSSEILESKIMRRVYLIYWYRRATSPTGLKLMGLAAFIGLSALLVSIQNVVYNLSHQRNLWEMLRYFSASLSKTEFPVKALFAAGIIFALIVIRDLFAQFRGRLTWVPFLASSH